jgi:PTH1 family peptidyl-tRNA hydrolase
VLLVAPQTFMNLSGQAVSQVVKFFQIEPVNLLVVCDDMNLPLARLRFRSSGSAGGQKGLKNIIESLATDAIPRLRFGIDRPPGQMDAVDYVLTRFRKAERSEVEAAVIRAADGVETWIRQGIAVAMNQFNGGEAVSPDDSPQA